MNATHIDRTIEAYESRIATGDEYAEYYRNVDGEWLEVRNFDNTLRSQYVNRQAVLFAIKEGF